MRRKMINRAVSIVLSAVMVLSTPISVGVAYAEELHAEVQTVVSMEESTSSSEEITTETASAENSEENSAETGAETEEAITVETLEEGITETTEETTEDVTIEEIVTEGIFLEEEYVNRTNFDLDAEGKISLKTGAKVGTSMKLPKGTKIIPAGIFTGNSTITSLTLDDGVTVNELVKIEANAFKGCTSLTSVPTEKVVEFGASSFEGCKSLTSCIITSATVVGDSAFKGCTAFAVKQKKDAETVFTDKLVTIGANAFEGTAIISLDASALGVSCNIGPEVFKGCTKLTDVLWSKKTTSIPRGTFNGCSSIVQLTIPENVISIDEDAFANCSKLYIVTINCPADKELTVHPSAFPYQTASWVHIKGYNEFLSTYCDSMVAQGYLYKYLPLDDKTYTAKAATVTGGKIMFSTSTGATTKEATPGSEVTAYLSAYKNYYILDQSTIYVKKDEGGRVSNLKIGAGPSGSIAVTFTMPAEPVTVFCTFETFDASKIVSFRYESPENATFKVENGHKYLYIPRAGMTVNFPTIYAKDSKGIETELSPTMFDWITDNPWIVLTKMAEITPTVSPREGVVVGSLKADPLKKVGLNVRCNEELAVEKLNMDFSIASGTGVKIPANRLDVDENGNYVIELPSSRVKNSNITINVYARPQRLGGTYDEDYTVYTDWKYNNAMAATTETRTPGSNKIVIKKGASGEFVVTATVANRAKGVPATVSRDVIIKVKDATPRITVTDLKVNYDSTTGAPFQLVPVYDKDIYKAEIPTVVTKAIVNGIEKPETYSGVSISYNGVTDTYYMIATSDCGVNPGQTKTFLGNSSLFIRGYYADENGAKAGTFDVPIAKVSIYRLEAGKAVTTKTKLTGKFNLFYNDSRAGYVDVSLDAVGESLDGTDGKCFVASTAACTEKPDNDAFTNNFDVSVINDKLVRITRTTNDLEKGLNGKIVNTGYLYLKYLGLREPIKVKITVPYAVTAPSYKLAINSAKASANGSGQIFTTYLIDNKTKKKYDILPTTVVTSSSDDFNVSVDSDTDIITIGVIGSPYAQKFNIKVQELGWENPINYPFTLKVTAAGILPTVKASCAVLTVNTNNIGLSDSLYLYSNNQTDAFVDDIEHIDYAGAVKNQGEADKLDVNYSGNTISVSINDASVKPGSYKYKAYPIVGYPGGSTYPTNKAVVFTVKVSNAEPTVVIKTGAAKLSTVCPGNEVANIGYTINNLPSVGATAVTVASITASNSNDVISNKLINDGLIAFDFSIPGCIMVTFTGTANSYAALGNFTGKFKVSGMEAVASNGNKVAVKDFVFTVKGNAALPVLSLKSQGKLNSINPIGYVQYTAVVKNINGRISSLDVYDYNGATPVPSEYFDVEEINCPGDWTVFKFYKKDGVEIDATKTYRYVFGYVLDCDSSNTVRYSNAINIKPTQVFPKLVVTQPRNSVYTGSSDANRYVTVNVDASAIAGAEINTFRLAAKNGAYYNNSLEIKDSEIIDNGNGTYTFKVHVKTPSKYIIDKGYNIYIEPVYVNQVKNTVATPFAIGLYVKK